MHTHLDCYPCFLRQALSGARIAGCDEATQGSILRRAMQMALEFDSRQPTVALGQQIYRVIREQSRNPDPYLALKRRSNRMALELIDDLRSVRDASPRPLETAVRIAVAGNIIDFGAQDLQSVPDIRATVRDCLSTPFERADIEPLEAAAQRARRVLVIGDNAGECVLDRLLIEQMPPGSVTYVVRSSPVINDALEEDARAAGIHEIARVITCGCDAPGALLDQCSPEFLEVLHDADLVISKGQGNYECLDGLAREVYFLLKTKCAVVARDLGVSLGAMVALRLGPAEG